MRPVARCQALHIEEPDWFQRPDVARWLDGPERPAAWHRPGEPADHRTGFVSVVEPGVRGSDALTAPLDVWLAMCRTAYEAHHNGDPWMLGRGGQSRQILVRVANTPAMELPMRKTARTAGLILNAPELFERPDFLAWLNDPENRVATWHKKGEEPGEYSDVFVLVDSDYEGPESDMPEDVWKAICDAAYAEYAPGSQELPRHLEAAIVVRLTNLEE